MTTEKLRSVFAESLGVSQEAIVDDLQYNGIPEWDSVAHMALVAALEDAFGILIETDDVIDMSSVGKAREILSKYGVEL
jgi:acyl carrier protein